MGFVRVPTKQGCGDFCITLYQRFSWYFVDWQDVPAVGERQLQDAGACIAKNHEIS